MAEASRQLDELISKAKFLDRLFDTITQFPKKIDPKEYTHELAGYIHADNCYQFLRRDSYYGSLLSPDETLERYRTIYPNKTVEISYCGQSIKGITVPDGVLLNGEGMVKVM
ncbi:hypothetical protein HY407_00345 [Candidatus Gottesmanbacteria bacterium]|nr:hypothetical protein [Candidatus Roizmanbacteria bacterium]MBI4066809.1 hypothetical protein [Candidatus Gottesmanbacteria bacterium]